LKVTRWFFEVDNFGFVTKKIWNEGIDTFIKGHKNKGSLTKRFHHKHKIDSYDKIFFGMETQLGYGSRAIRTETVQP
jgi:hypothetical protein